MQANCKIEKRRLARTVGTDQARDAGADVERNVVQTQHGTVTTRHLVKRNWSCPAHEPTAVRESRTNLNQRTVRLRAVNPASTRNGLLEFMSGEKAQDRLLVKRSGSER